MLIQFSLIMMMSACALYDLVEFRIPNILVGGIAVLFVILVVVHRLSLTQIAGHLTVAVIILICTAVLFRFGLLGGGDVKLLAATCLWAGPNMFLAHLLVTSFFAVGLLVAILIVRKLYPAVLAIVPSINALPVPRVLLPGAGVPYGIAISASAIVLGMPRAM